MSIIKKGVLYRLLVSVLIGHFITVIGTPNWFYGFIDEYYFLEFSLSAGSVVIILEYTHHINQYLDSLHDWRNHFIKRFLWQLLLSVMVPLGMAVLSTYLQSTFIFENSGIWGRGYLESEFPISCLFVIIVNFFYVILNLFKSKNELPDKIISNPIVIGKRRNNNVPIKAEEISHLILKNDVIHLTTLDNEQVILSENLDHYQQLLIHNTFFRVNRQSIINKSACKSYSAIENGKIEILLNPDGQESLIVSQKRAAQFRSWIKG